MPHAVFHRRLGGPEVLEYAEVASADPAAGEVAVRIEAAGVNPIDAKLRSGLRASTPIEGRRGVGSDGAGIVLAVGDDVAGFRPGMPVVVSGAQGTYAEEAIVPASALTLRPPAVDAETGAAIGIPVATAYQALRSLAVGPGDRLLVHGGSGAVGQAVIQFAVRWDADVLATTSERRADRVRALGAVPVAYGPGLVERVGAAGTGIDVALDWSRSCTTAHAWRRWYAGPMHPVTASRPMPAAQRTASPISSARGGAKRFPWRWG